MILLDIVQHYLTPETDIETVLSQIDIRLRIDSELSRGYGSSVDRVITGTVDIYYAGELIESFDDTCICYDVDCF